MSALLRPRHGGDVARLYKELGLDRSNVLDLSSAVNPFAYPNLGDLNDSWRELPSVPLSLDEVMADYYQSAYFCVTPGSQWAIEYLPKLLGSFASKSLRVLLPTTGYAEHDYAWRRSAAEIVPYATKPSHEQIELADVCVLINPNNPSGRILPSHDVLELARHASESNTWLIVDEAFVDFHSSSSVSPHVGQGDMRTLIVLRSFGKFSGLPGARIGAIGAAPDLLTRVREDIPLWGVCGPGLELFERVLRDSAWRTETISKIQSCSHALDSALRNFFMNIHSDVYLFATVLTEDAARVFEHLRADEIFSRLLDDERGLRFSLAKDATQLVRLQTSLAQFYSGESRYA